MSDTLQIDTVQQEGYWTRQDTIRARSIFQSPTWQKMMFLAKKERPTVNAKTREDRCDQAIEFQTWENFLNFFSKIEAGKYEEGEQENLGMIDMSIPRTQR